MAGFETGSVIHLGCLMVCGVATLGVVGLARAVRGTGRERWFRLAIGWGSVGVWVMQAVFMVWPGHFAWRWSLPLHFCNLANLIGAVAVLTGRRRFQAVLYFWAFALCLWAFLTPTLDAGPGRVAFWVFWAYHVMIPVSVVEVLVVQGFRPGWADYRQAVIWTVAYAAGLAGLNAATGWNYGFVGPWTPSQPTPLGVLGPYPWRLLWMGALGAGVFALLVLPWRKGVEGGG